MRAWPGSLHTPATSSALNAATQIVACSRRAGLLDLLAVPNTLAGILLYIESKKAPNFAGITRVL